MFNKKRVYNSIGYGVAGGIVAMVVVAITAPFGYDATSVGTGFLFGAVTMGAMGLRIATPALPVTGGV